MAIDVIFRLSPTASSSTLLSKNETTFNHDHIQGLLFISISQPPIIASKKEKVNTEIAKMEIGFASVANGRGLKTTIQRILFHLSKIFLTKWKRSNKSNIGQKKCKKSGLLELTSLSSSS